MALDAPDLGTAAKTALVPFGVVAGAAGGGYLAWSAYWGIPAAWRWWRGLFYRIGCILIANPLTWVFLLVSFFVVPLYFGYLYGVFGGALYEYRKAKALAAIP